ncbi:MAG: hypothetical protein II699_02470 [Lachnospiraceae bacterium]|nr:hypothetical protein [Lachnospiraceae bacterium]
MNKLISCVTCAIICLNIILGATSHTHASEKITETGAHSSGSLINIAEETDYLESKYNKELWLSNDSIDYPVTPNDKSWANLKSHDEMVKACNIPSKLINKLSTRDLVKLLYDYPLLIDMYMYDNLDDGLKCIVSQSNIIGELYARDDFLDIIEQDVFKMDYDQSYTDFKKYALAELLLEDGKLSTNYLVSDKNAKQQANTKKQIRVDTINICKGKTTKGIVYEYAGDKWASELNAETRKTYPLAIFVSKSDNRYNCHSYAWYKQSTSNPYWINSPTDYINSGLYSYSKKASNNCKIVYVKNSERIHSGIVTDASNMKIKSKWGMGPLMIHDVNYCPYNSCSYSYYKKK